MTKMTPLAYYQSLAESNQIIEDNQQLEVMKLLQNVHENLLKEHQRRRRFYHAFRRPQAVSGLYLWGGVGIGKTFVMDCFYECVPFQEKMRMHFHSFMQNIHQQLITYQGKKNPLMYVAKRLADETMLLCFDELHVTDIVDAMILARLFSALHQYGVTIVTTSNVRPDDLYKNGLQRPLFIPAIDLLKRVTTVMHVSTNIDYRLCGTNTMEDNLSHCFTMLAAGQEIQFDDLVVHDRPIRIIKESLGVVWFDFKDICSVPRSQHDYLALAEKYQTIIVSNIPRIFSHEKDTIRLFVRLIDVLYDAGTRFVFSSDVNIDDVYTEGDMLFEFARTKSRLHEMQSDKYVLNTRKVGNVRA